jgi:YfiH family protein
VPSLTSPFEWRGELASGDPVSGDPLWIEAVLPNGRAAFTTRLGGVSEGPYRALNLGILTDDERAHVECNRERLARALGRSAEGFVMGRQVHGAELQLHERAPRRSAFAERGTDLREADGQIATSAALTPLVLVADCLPLVLAAEGAVAVVHCGWRGVAAGIVGKALASLCEPAGTRLADVTAALGPRIGRCCYEVGDDVARIFHERGLGPAPALHTGFLDLAGAVQIELERAGVDPEQLLDAALCTSCHPELFFSHRRDGGVTGRQAGLAWLRP